MRYGGVEAGGTKWNCAVGSSEGQVTAQATVPTTTPAETLARVVEFFAAHTPLAAIGVGAFGPVDIAPSSPTFGHITTTPKPGWLQTDVVSPFRESLNVPVALDTDVNAAALGEHRWGAGVGLSTFTYITVGTGIGAGSIVNGAPLHGLLHPEFGHMRIPREREGDSFEGACPYHADCLEGLASGEAIRARWGSSPEELGSEHPAWELEAHYLASALTNLICVLSPERIIVGGGLTRQRGLIESVREHVTQLLATYLDVPEFVDPFATRNYIVPPSLGDEAGVLGALELARQADPADINGTGMTRRMTIS